jgi:molybdate transport system substrate-binding protein
VKHARAPRGGSVALALLLVAGLPASAPAAAAPAPVTLRVFAAASLGEAFADLARAFERAHPGTHVQLVLAGSQQLAAQLAQGATGDVLATADTRTMDDARQHWLLAGESATFARNRLLVIVPATNPARLRTWRDLERRGLKLVIGADAVPAGHYARVLFANLGATAGAGAGWPGRVLANVVSDEENVKSVLAKVQLGEADAGVVYRTDVTPALARFVHTLAVPDSANVVAAYPIAALARAPRAELARAFVDMALSPSGRVVLAKHGFLPPAGAP